MARPTPLFGRKYQKGINWITAIAMTGFHIGAVAALFHASTGPILTAVLLWAVAGMLGIGMGYHRLLTHRGYKTSRPVEYFLTLCGTLALEGGPIFWVATHRIHHQNSDHEGDPHTPREGTFWAHMGWILLGDGLHRDSSILQRYAPDLSRDRFHVWLSSWHWLTNVIVGLFLLVVGGWPYVFWGIFFRTTWGLHSTWLVNSATHLWGSRRFTTRDDSTNNWWVALLTFGEGWHNNHHAHPVSARHGLAWYELDLNYIGIRTLQTLGLVWDVKTARLTDSRTTEDTRAAARYERPAAVAVAGLAAVPVAPPGAAAVRAEVAERQEELEFA
jgi:stearoyl-CoA desaturase (delta-9 desaturase)